MPMKQKLKLEIRFFSMLLFSILLLSCNRNKIFEEHQDLSPNLEWKKDLKINFNPDISDIDARYNVTIAFRHAHGYAYSNLPLRVKIISPSGKVSEKHYNIEVVDDSGQYKGEGIGDIWDLDFVAEENFAFSEVGTHQFFLEHELPVDPLNMAIELGLKIEKTKE